MGARIVKSFSDDITSYRIVEVFRDNDGLDRKLVLEYRGEDLMGGDNWRQMCATGAALEDLDPLGVLLRELKQTGWFL